VAFPETDTEMDTEMDLGMDLGIVNTTWN